MIDPFTGREFAIGRKAFPGRCSLQFTTGRPSRPFRQGRPCSCSAGASGALVVPAAPAKAGNLAAMAFEEFRDGQSVVDEAGMATLTFTTCDWRGPFSRAREKGRPLVFVLP